MNNPYVFVPVYYPSLAIMQHVVYCYCHKLLPIQDIREADLKHNIIVMCLCFMLYMYIIDLLDIHVCAIWFKAYSIK